MTKIKDLHKAGAKTRRIFREYDALEQEFTVMALLLKHGPARVLARQNWLGA